MDRDAVIDLLRTGGLLPPGGSPQMSPLTGGYWNQVWRLQDDTRDWVVKLFDPHAEPRLFPVLPDSEARAMTALSGLGLAPDPVAYLPRAADRPAVLIYRFHEGRPWQSGTAKVARLLKRQHGLAPEGFRLLATEPEAILAQGDWLIRHLEDDAYVARLRARRPAPLRLAPPRLAFVHTDAGPGNLIEGPQGLRLIDWQCPGLGDPAEDLFSFLAPCFQILFQHAPLSDIECADFLAAYDDAGVAARFRQMEPFYAYRMLAYCCLRRVRLSDRDKTAAERYRSAFEAQLPLLGAGRGSVPA
jgi:aminoglycoside phosphotransferase (APT) family kinase protein